MCLIRITPNNRLRVSTGFAEIEATELGEFSGCEIARQNPHGYSISRHSRRKGWNTLRSLDFVESPDGGAIQHWRYATRGQIDIANTHPFVLDDGALLWHNGSIDYLGNSEYSDTASLAGILSQLDIYSRIKVLVVIAKRRNRFALSHPSKPQVTLFGDWTLSNGVYYSQQYWSWQSQRTIGFESAFAKPAAKIIWKQGKKLPAIARRFHL